MIRLYKRLLAGPCDPGRAGNQVLVMAKVCVTDHPVGVHGGTPTLDGARVLWFQDESG